MDKNMEQTHETHHSPCRIGDMEYTQGDRGKIYARHFSTNDSYEVAVEYDPVTKYAVVFDGEEVVWERGIGDNYILKRIGDREVTYTDATMTTIARIGGKKFEGDIPQLLKRPW